MTDSTGLTDLEQAVLRKYCDIENLAVPSMREISFHRREKNPVGFMTEFSVENYAALRFPERVYQNIPDAHAEKTGDRLGFLIFFEADCVAIEGFVYGRSWPPEEYPIEFFPSAI